MSRIGVATQLTNDEVRALTAVGDEQSATLSKMPELMVDALVRAGARASGN
ncbi:MAG TPA: hypothetical protein VF926_04705 [Mycobacterium sp.]